MQAATEQYRSDSDQVGRWLGDCTEADATYATSISDLYQSYKEWCKDTGEFALSQNLWGRRMSERGFMRDRRFIAAKVVRVLLGVRLLHDAFDAFDTFSGDSASGKISRENSREITSNTSNTSCDADPTHKESPPPPDPTTNNTPPPPFDCWREGEEWVVYIPALRRRGRFASQAEAEAWAAERVREGLV